MPCGTGADAWGTSTAVPIMSPDSAATAPMGWAATTIGCATATGTLAGTLMVIGEPAATPGGHTTCIGPVGVLT